MAHEELKKQYEEDCKGHERPWELWEYLDYGCINWADCLRAPSWHPGTKYSRKEPPFTPEYFSGLNWRKAEKLVGEKVEFSDDPDNCGWKEGVLKNIQEGFTCKFRLQRTDACYTYIRTIPETYAHQTITVGDVELPRPEVDAPEEGTKFWVWVPYTEFLKYSWEGDSYDRAWLSKGMVHLTEDRVQAWTDWWENIVMAAVRGGE